MSRLSTASWIQLDNGGNFHSSFYFLRIPKQFLMHHQSRKMIRIRSRMEKMIPTIPPPPSFRVVREMTFPPFTHLSSVHLPVQHSAFRSHESSSAPLLTHCPFDLQTVCPGHEESSEHGLTAQKLSVAQIWPIRHSPAEHAFFPHLNPSVSLLRQYSGSTHSSGATQEAPFGLEKNLIFCASVNAANVATAMTIETNERVVMVLWDGMDERRQLVVTAVA